MNVALMETTLRMDSSAGKDTGNVRERDIQMGELAVRKGPWELTSSAVGSCLVITLYDQKQKIGAARGLPQDRQHLPDLLEQESAAAPNVLAVGLASEFLLVGFPVGGVKDSDLGLACWVRHALRHRLHLTRFRRNCSRGVEGAASERKRGLWTLPARSASMDAASP